VRVIVFRLTFSTGFHLAPHELGLDETRPTIPSDTLFSALLWAWIRSGGDPAAWLSPFLSGNPPFLITSAFPWFEDTLWFPKPKGFQPTPAWKKVAFLPEPVLQRIAKNGGRPKEPPKEEKFWEIEQVPHVTIDRLTNRTNLFYLGRVRFHGKAGLWFGLRWLNHTASCGSIPFSEAFRRALEELALTGLGGDRSTGFGKFQVEEETREWPDPDPQGFGLLLSRLWPSDQDLALLPSIRAWRIVEVGGFAETAAGHVRRQRVRLIEEGSVVPARVRGGLADLTPPEFTAHRIWRYGLAFLYPWEVGYEA